MQQNIVATPDQYEANEKAFEDAVNNVYESGRVKPADMLFFRESPDGCLACAVGAAVVSLIDGELTMERYYDPLRLGSDSNTCVCKNFGLHPDFVAFVTHGFDATKLQIDTDNARRGYKMGKRLRERWIK